MAVARRKLLRRQQQLQPRPRQAKLPRHHLRGLPKQADGKAKPSKKEPSVAKAVAHGAEKAARQKTISGKISEKPDPAKAHAKVEAEKAAAEKSAKALSEPKANEPAAKKPASKKRK